MAEQPNQSSQSPTDDYNAISNLESSQTAIGNYNAVAGPYGTATVNVYQLASANQVDPKEIENANQHLENLPLDVIPEVADLPLGTRMPFSHNPLFVGRGDEFKEVAEFLKDGQTVIIAGLGGIGKTQLASEIVHRYGQYFEGGVFWLSFSDPDIVSSEIANCGGVGHLDLRPDYHMIPVNDQVRLVSAAWQSSMPRLLIFDNCDEETLLANWRPPTGECRVLVTSRRAKWDTSLNVHTLTLGVLDQKESVILLRKYRPDLPPDHIDLNTIAEELGGLPLAIHLAGSFLNYYKHSITPQSYVESLRNIDVLNHPSLQGKGSSYSPTDHELHIARTFALSFDKLILENDIDKIAISILKNAAWFSPGDAISRELLISTLEQSSDELDLVLNIEEGIQRLINLGLITEEENGVILVHPLISIYVRNIEMTDKHFKLVSETIAKKAMILSRSGFQAPFSNLPAHLNFLAKQAAERKDVIEIVLMQVIGDYSFSIGDHKSALTAYTRALRFQFSLIAKDDPRVASSHNKIGMTFLELGNISAAQIHLEEACTITLKNFGEQHIDSIMGLNNLGMLHYRKGDYQKAKQILEHALKNHEEYIKDIKDNTLSFANILQNLGGVYHKIEYIEKARDCFEKALSIHVSEYGYNSSFTIGSLNNLGNFLVETGNLIEGQAHLKKSVTLADKIMGEGHSQTSIPLMNLGITYLRDGDLDIAKEYFDRSEGILTKIGGIHPSMPTLLRYQGMVHEEKGENGTALKLHKKALEFQLQIQPDDIHVAFLHIRIGQLFWAQKDSNLAQEHFSKAFSQVETQINNPSNSIVEALEQIGTNYMLMENLTESKRCFELALEIRRNHLNTPSPNIGLATNLNYLGAIAYHSQKFKEGSLYFEKLLTIQDDAFGPSDSRSINTYIFLGEISKNQGDLESALEYFSEARDRHENPPESLEVSIASVLHALGMVNYNNNDFEKAEDYYRRAIEIKIQVYGSEHIETAISLKSLAYTLHSLKKYSDAENLYRKVYDIRKSELSLGHEDTIAVVEDLGRLYLHQKDYKNARQQYKKTLSLTEKYQGQNKLKIAQIQTILGDILHSQNAIKGARIYYTRALASYSKIYNSNHPEILKITKKLEQ